MSLTNARTIALQYQTHLSRIAALLAGVCALSVLLYGIFLLEAVAHAAARESAQRKIQTINTEVSTLEAHYLTATQTITPERALALGFIEPTVVSTVRAKVPAEPLTIR